MSESEYECPTCGDTLDTKAGLFAHHKHSHDQSLTVDRLKTAKCIGCEQQFRYDPKFRSGDVCLKCARQYPGHGKSDIIPRLMKQMPPEKLLEEHDDDTIHQWWKNNE